MKKYLFSFILAISIMACSKDVSECVTECGVGELSVVDTVRVFNFSVISGSSGMFFTRIMSDTPINQSYDVEVKWKRYKLLMLQGGGQLTLIDTPHYTIHFNPLDTIVYNDVTSMFQPRLYSPYSYIVQSPKIVSVSCSNPYYYFKW